MVSKWGNCLGYSNLPCPSCGRIRLENYENGKQICEKCRWCPQEERYVESEEVYPTEENDVDSIGDYLIAELSKEVKGVRDMSNKEYISKQEALSKLWRRNHHEDYDDDMFGEILKIEEEIKSMPCIDVVEREKLVKLLERKYGNLDNTCGCNINEQWLSVAAIVELIEQAAKESEE